MPIKKQDPAIEWLSSRVAPLSPRDFLFQQARELLAKSGQLEPPFDPLKAIPPSVKKIEIAEISRDGMLIPTEQGFIIKLNSKRPLVRQRFACAHEIGHTFFFDLSGRHPWRPYESLSSYWAEEDICYQFAEEMLVPEESLQKITRRISSPSINNFKGLLNTFRVSAEVLARRIVRLNLWECIIVILTKDDGTSGLLKRHRVCKHRSYRNTHIRWDTLLSENSNPYIAFNEPGLVKRSIVKGGELFREAQRDKDWCLESGRFEGKNSPIVVSIIAPNEISKQLTKISSSPKR